MVAGLFSCPAVETILPVVVAAAGRIALVLVYKVARSRATGCASAKRVHVFHRRGAASCLLARDRPPEAYSIPAVRGPSARSAECQGKIILSTSE